MTVTQLLDVAPSWELTAWQLFLVQQAKHQEDEAEKRRQDRKYMGDDW